MSVEKWLGVLILLVFLGGILLGESMKNSWIGIGIPLLAVIAWFFLLLKKRE